METKLDELTALLPKAILSISLFHVSACVLYIIGYSFGFGHNLVAFFTPNDIFSIGLRDLTYVYLCTIAIPAFVKLHRLRQEKPYASDIVAAIPDETERMTAAGRLIKIRSIISLVVYVLVAISIVYAAYAFYRGWPYRYVVATFPIYLMITRFSQNIQTSLKIDYKVFEVADLVLVMMLSSLAFGAYFGELDKNATYETISKDTFICSKYAIIRGVSDNFLAVRTDDVKAVIDQSCETLFEIPS